MAITTFPNEKILWHKGKYYIIEADIFPGRRNLVLSDGWRTDVVVNYGDGTWATDNPEYYPKYVKDKVYSIVGRFAYMNEDYLRKMKII